MTEVDRILAPAAALRRAARARSIPRAGDHGPLPPIEATPNGGRARVRDRVLNGSEAAEPHSGPLGHAIRRPAAADGRHRPSERPGPTPDPEAAGRVDGFRDCSSHERARPERRLMADLETLDALDPPSPAWLWPAGGYVTSTFGWRRNPVSGRGWDHHSGLDISNKQLGRRSGRPAAGKVKKAWFNAGYGNMIVIDHGFGITTVYAHCSPILRARGRHASRPVSASAPWGTPAEARGRTCTSKCGSTVPCRRPPGLPAPLTGFRGFRSRHRAYVRACPPLPTFRVKPADAQGRKNPCSTQSRTSPSASSAMPTSASSRSSSRIVDAINALEPSYEKLTDERARGQDGGVQDPPRERRRDPRRPAGRGLRHRARGRQAHACRCATTTASSSAASCSTRARIAEMKTGEGKTLVATLPVYLNALEGKGAHVVTVNDYLAKRDAEWMSPIYNFLGMSVGSILSGERNDRDQEARLRRRHHLRHQQRVRLRLPARQHEVRLEDRWSARPLASPSSTRSTPSSSTRRARRSSSAAHADADGRPLQHHRLRSSRCCRTRSTSSSTRRRGR